MSIIKIYREIELPLIPVIADMEDAGIRIDISLLGKLSEEFKARIAELEQEIYSIVGKEFNIASPRQLGEILFEDMGIEGAKKTKTGAYKTGVEILEELSASGHTIADKVLEWRHFSKLTSNYTDTLPKQAINGRVHTSYSMTGAMTGRLSSSDPNLQNIPIRTEEGRKIRQAFIADDGYKLIAADYSQIELRILAHIADIEPLKTAFINGEDIHSATARDMFGVDEVSSELRRKAKTINFGIIYGISPHGLAMRLGITRDEASRYMTAYFEKYGGIKKYMDEMKQKAKKDGFVETIFGRRCYIKGINDKNANIRGFSERLAINAPIQGTAADIIKMAMIDVHKSLQSDCGRGVACHALGSGTPDPYTVNTSKKLKNTKMLLQVHDELIFETKENEVDEAMKLIKDKMENAVKLSIPLTVDINSGDNWDEVH